MNLLVIDLLLLYKAQISGKWAKRRGIHHQNKQHAEPSFMKISVSIRQISVDFCRWLRTMSLVDIQLGKKEYAREGRQVCSKPGMAAV